MRQSRDAARLSVARDLSAALYQMVNAAHGGLLHTLLWRDQADQCLSAMLTAYTFLRQHDDPCLTAKLISDTFWHLGMLEALAWDEAEQWDMYRRSAGYFAKVYQSAWYDAAAPLREFIRSLPGYAVERRGRQKQEACDQYTFVVRQMSSICCVSQQGNLGLIKLTLPVQLLPEAEIVNRILILDRGVKKDGIATDCRETVRCK